MRKCSQASSSAGVAHAGRHAVDGEQQGVAQLLVVRLAPQAPQNLHLWGRGAQGYGAVACGDVHAAQEHETPPAERGESRSCRVLAAGGSIAVGVTAQSGPRALRPGSRAAGPPAGLPCTHPPTCMTLMGSTCGLRISISRL